MFVSTPIHTHTHMCVSMCVGEGEMSVREVDNGN